MRFTEQMIGERGTMVRLVQQGQLTQREAATELGVSERQVRRWVRRVETAAGAEEPCGITGSIPCRIGCPRGCTRRSAT